ncbi:MAG TPA: 16S rRNA (guanine(527)-N(7))-methyltransferase RsmG [Mycobacteriales bacterium]|nr:16S rRNA (guanine(527)-N(7))-methyltransferase RsmG [Mycobacteriales bacterium]
MPAAAADLFGTALERAARYAELLVGPGAERGLIGPREAGRIWSRHLLPSAVLSELVPPAAAVADLGSGAGLPGIPLALVRPDVSVVLVEPMVRRTAFLTEVIAALELTNAQVVRSRAEEHAAVRPGRYDIVVARAVTDLASLWTWARSLLRPAGVLLAVKGARAAAEVEAAAAVLARAGGSAEIVELGRDNPPAATTVVRVTGSGA